MTMLRIQKEAVPKKRKKKYVLRFSFSVFCIRKKWVAGRGVEKGVRMTFWSQMQAEGRRGKRDERKKGHTLASFRPK